MIAISNTDLKGLRVLNRFFITLFKFDFIDNAKMEFNPDLMWCKYDKFRGSMRQRLESHEPNKPKLTFLFSINVL